MNDNSKLNQAKKELKQQQNKAVEKVCSCRIPTDEYEKIESEIKELGYKNMSSYFREILTARKREYNLSELEEYKIFLIGKISNNINQIAKTMHQDIKKNGNADYQKVNRNLENYLNELYTLIG